jgi:hypothetical protein
MSRSKENLLGKACYNFKRALNKIGLTSSNLIVHDEAMFSIIITKIPKKRGTKK